MSEIQSIATGRRKESVARVRLIPGSGQITVNGKDLDKYFGMDTLKLMVRQPLEATETLDRFDVIARVHGGGFSGQAGAVRHGIARALVQVEPS
ncbi:MAG: 30S ribosomal protein S9, partial [Dethiobacteria bacterium]